MMDMLPVEKAARISRRAHFDEGFDGEAAAPGRVQSSD
jgi:hypothetical protein